VAAGLFGGFAPELIITYFKSAIVFESLRSEELAINLAVTFRRFRPETGETSLNPAILSHPMPAIDRADHRLE